MSTEKRVALKSLVNYTVVITVPDLHFRREFKKVNEVRYVPYDTMLELVSNPGVSKMIEEGIIYVMDEEDRIAFGLQEEPEKPSFVPLTDLEILKLLKSETIEKFTSTINDQPIEQVKRIAEVAIKNKAIDYNKNEILKSACGVDALGAIQEINEA